MSTQNFRIATWNVERPKLLSKRVPAINAELIQHSADIFILTETHESISPGHDYSVRSTNPLEREQDGVRYNDGERRVSIFADHSMQILDHLEVSNPSTTVCVLIETPHGPLAVYGCIIGIRGRGKGFDTDLAEQIEDLKRITKQYPVCYAGDFNLSFCDSYYTKKDAKLLLEDAFSALKLRNLTSGIPENIDHIAISESFLSKTPLTEICCWNLDKKLSDHKGVMVSLQC